MYRENAERAHWVSKGYVSSYRKRIREDYAERQARYMVEALSTIAPTQEATAAIITVPIVTQFGHSRSGKPLPDGCVKKEDANGHWAYHTAPVGDPLPPRAEDMNHHCRLCGSEGTADSLQNALFASINARESFASGTHPCHGYTCIYIGLYCKRRSDEEHKAWVKEDGKDGSNSTWIEDIRYGDAKSPAISSSNGVRRSGYGDNRYVEPAQDDWFEKWENTLSNRYRERILQRYDRALHTPQGTAWKRAKTEELPSHTLPSGTYAHDPHRK